MPKKTGKKDKRRKNPIVIPPKEIAAMLSGSVGNLALSMACDGMTFEHKMIVAAIISTHLRPMLGYPVSMTIPMTNKESKDPV